MDLCVDVAQWVWLAGCNILISSDFEKLQKSVKHLQYSRSKLTMDQQLGEGCFGEVSHLSPLNILI